MSRINEKLGLKTAGARARLNALSGVRCPACPGADVRPNQSKAAYRWFCGFCGYTWAPTADEIATYNARVRERDRIKR